MLREVPLTSCNAVVVLMKSFRFCMSVKLLIYPSDLNKSLDGNLLGYRLCPFITLNISCHSVLKVKVIVA